MRCQGLRRELEDELVVSVEDGVRNVRQTVADQREIRQEGLKFVVASRALKIR